MKLLLQSCVVAALLAAGIWQGVLFQRIAPPVRDQQAGLIFLPSAAQARILSLGYTSVVADYYWVRALQYYTNPANENVEYRSLADFLEVVIGVDPDYRFAYKFAGLSVPWDSGRFRFRHTRRSTSFLERGVARFPDWWELHFLLGYNYLNFANEPEKAGEQFRQASLLPNAPTYLAAFSTRVFVVGGQLERALAVAAEMMNVSTDPEIRDLMKTRYEVLLVERELQRIEAGARAYHERHGRFPVGIQALVDDGFSPSTIPHVKLDPDGVARAPGAERMKVYQLSGHQGFGAID